MFAHSQTEGRCRFSGLAFHGAARLLQTEFGPTTPGFFLLEDQPFSHCRNQIIVRELVVFLWL